MDRQLTIELTDMAHGGQAVGREAPGGKAVFVPFALPGEVARVQVIHDRGNMARGRILEILSASPSRQEPPCPYFGTCGGCHWQHASYLSQLEYKRSIVRAQLQRIGGVSSAEVYPTMGMETPWAYRNHVQFGISPEGALGFMAAGSHEVVPIKHCLLLDPLLTHLVDSLDMELAGLRQLVLRAGIRTGELMIVAQVRTRASRPARLDPSASFVSVAPDGSVTTVVGTPHFHEKLANRTYRISATSFFQVNTLQAERLVAIVTEAIRNGPPGTLVDAYCGVGTFALAAAGDVDRAIGIETSGTAILDAKANGAGLDHVSFMHGTVEDVLPALGVQPAQIVVDPPRAGVEKTALRAILQQQPQQIIYISCDPATLARDVRDIIAAGYCLRWVQPVDMFPQTYHVECVVLMSRV